MPHFDGMADVGDGVVPVIDLRKQVAASLGVLSATEKDQPPCILTLLEGAMAGILVDQALSIRNVPADRFEAVKDGTKLQISHVVPLNGRMLSVLTIDRLLPAARSQQPTNRILEGAGSFLFYGFKPKSTLKSDKADDMY